MAKTFLKESRVPLQDIRRAGKLDGDVNLEQGTHLARSIQSVTILVLGISVLSGLLFVGLHRHSKMTAKRPSVYESVVTISPQYLKETGEKLTNEPLGALAAEKLVSDALRSSSDNIAKRFRLENGMSSQAAYDMLGGIQKAEGDVTALKWLGIRYIGERVIEEVTTSSSNGKETSVRLAQITHQLDGSHKVDFSSYVRKSSHPWEEIVDGNVQRCVVRVMIVKSAYHNGVFQDDTKWRCFKIASPDMDANLHVYAEVGSEEEIRIRDILATDQKSPRVTLEIRRDKSLLPRQFKISQVVAQDWIENDLSMDSAGR